MVLDFTTEKITLSWCPWEVRARVLEKWANGVNTGSELCWQYPTPLGTEVPVNGLRVVGTVRWCTELVCPRPSTLHCLCRPWLLSSSWASWVFSHYLKGNVLGPNWIGSVCGVELSLWKGDTMSRLLVATVSFLEVTKGLLPSAHLMWAQGPGFSLQFTPLADSPYTEHQTSSS